jgi:hypothetical protein
MSPKTDKEDINRAAPSILTQDQKIRELEKLLAESKLELRAYREAMRNAKALDEIHGVKWQLAAIDRLLLNDQKFIDHWKNMVQVNDRRSAIKG